MSAASAAGGDTTSSTTDGASASPGTWFNRTELYFGTGKPDGTEVTPDEFDRFSDPPRGRPQARGLTQQQLMTRTPRADYRGLQRLPSMGTSLALDCGSQ